MQIFLIRHGMTEGNKFHKYIGRTDEPLCEEGIEEAGRCGPYKGVKKVFVTPYIRTQQTASIIYPNAEQIIVDGLKEMDFGDFENRSYEDMRTDRAYRKWIDEDCEGDCPNGERMDEFSERVCRAFEDTLDLLREQRVDKAYFVVHGGTIMAIMWHFVNQSAHFYDFRTRNCCGYLLDYYDLPGDNKRFQILGQLTGKPDREDVED